MFLFVDTDLKIDKPQATVEIDRDKTAPLGLTMSDVGSALGAVLGGGYVNYFALAGRSYKVIPQVQQRYRAEPRPGARLLHSRRPTARPIPPSTVATHQDRHGAAVDQPLPAAQRGDDPGRAGARRVAGRRAAVPAGARGARRCRRGYSVDYAGLSRQYVQESGGFVLTFGFALIIIFLALAALFESFRDPLVILVSVPMSFAGALIFVNLGLGGASLNIYTEVGLVTLMGLISKHGILIVEFANKPQQAGHVASARRSRRPPASACGRS